MRESRLSGSVEGVMSDHDSYSDSLQLPIPFSPLDVVNDVPGVNTGRDEFRALLEQLGERLLPALIDEGHAREVHHALAFPASGFCSCPVGLQLRDPRLNEPALERPPLLGKCFCD